MSYAYLYGYAQMGLEAAAQLLKEGRADEAGKSIESTLAGLKRREPDVHASQEQSCPRCGGAGGASGMGTPDGWEDQPCHFGPYARLKDGEQR